MSRHEPEPTVIRRRPQALAPRDPAPGREAPPSLPSLPRRLPPGAGPDAVLLPNVAAPHEPVAFPPVTDTDWRTLSVRDAEGTAAEEVGAYLRDPKNVRRWHVAVKGMLNELDCGLGEKSRALKVMDEVAHARNGMSDADREVYNAAHHWKIRAKRLLAALRTRGTETSQAIRALDEATHFGGARQRKAEQLLAWAASVIPRDGEGEAWHAAATEHWKGVLPVGEVAESETVG